MNLKKIIREEVFNEELEYIENTYFKPGKVKEILDIEEYTNQRRGHKNYIKVTYIEITSPQWNEPTWVIFPYNTEEEKYNIYGDLFYMINKYDIDSPFDINDVSDNFFNII